ncbi:MAG: YdeI/OmpD-associated family protein [Gaiellaceae bacterium]
MSAGPHGHDRVELTDRAAWRRWLEQNHATAKGVWVVTRRKRAGAPRLDYDALVEEALCFGWVDSREQPLDNEWLMQLIRPRRPGSAWARSNKERIARLEQAGVMADAGRRVVEAAKADGSWSRYDSAEALEIPADLESALAANAPAARNFAAFTDAARRTILRWLIDAKRPETRAKRIDETVRLAALNEKAGP